MAGTMVTSLNSIDDLRDYAVDRDEDNGKVIQVGGYYAACDGGGGAYYFNKDEVYGDNGGTVIKPDNISGDGRWLLLSDTINIRQFGAQCLELQVANKYPANLTAAQNSDRINAAITYCAEKKISLFVPSGTYIVDTLDFNPYRNTSGSGASIINSGRYGIYGEGSSSKADLTGTTPIYLGSVLKASGGSAEIAPFNASWGLLNGKRVYGMELAICDLALIGDVENSVLDAQGAFKSQFRNLTIQNKHANGYGLDLSDTDQLLVENLLILSKNPDNAEGRSSKSGLMIESEVIQK